MSRSIQHIYQDPLDATWLSAAHAVGLKVVRSDASYASYDGHGTLSLADAASMDSDDCLAQMILHELCHALVQGTQSFGWVDWGLDNEGDRDREREHACLRLQAALLEPWGLREMLAPTTDFRSYYDALCTDPFQEREISERESITRARAAYGRRHRRPVRGHLDAALRRTAAICDALSDVRNELPATSLLVTAKPVAPLHESGLFTARQPRSDCGHCAWSFDNPGQGSALSCRLAPDRRVQAESANCENFEEKFDCSSCGACCREAYDTVEVCADDPAARLHLPLLMERGDGYDLRRVERRCTCLEGGAALSPPRPSISGGQEPDDAGTRVAPLFMPNERPFSCSIYETRPQTCRDFSIFSDNCLQARRTVGLSR
jgi:Fe-S-cluster containining protein